MALIGFSEYEGMKVDLVEKLEDEADVVLLDPEQEHPEKIPDLDLYHAARVREGAIEDYATAVAEDVPTVHNPGWIDLWNERDTLSDVLEDAGLNVPHYEVWNGFEDAFESDLEFPVFLQPNSHFDEGRHETEAVTMDGIENSEILEQGDVYASEFVEHDTAYKILRIGDEIDTAKYEDVTPFSDQGSLSPEHVEITGWMEDISESVYDTTGEKIWEVDLIEGEERYAVDLNMVCYPKQMEDGPEIYARHILGQLDETDYPLQKKKSN